MPWDREVVRRGVSKWNRLEKREQIPKHSQVAMTRDARRCHSSGYAGAKVPKASDLKRSSVVAIDSEPHSVRDIEVRSPSARGAATLYKFTLTNLITGRKFNETFKGDDYLAEADAERVALQYSYLDGNELIFMDEEYAQHGMARDQIAEQAAYITDGIEGITGLLVEGVLRAIELPQSVTLEIVETSPAMKGASANARTKPATLNTGHVVNVPEYIETGEKVRVNTGDGKFMSRAT
jgi:elongation factor P